MNKLNEIFVEALKVEVQKRAENLLELDLNEGNGGKYFQGYDKDFVDNGVGFDCVRCDTIQDEDQAREDAKEELIDEMTNADYETFYNLIEDENVRNSVIELLKGL